LLGKAYVGWPAVVVAGASLAKDLAKNR